MHGVSGRELRHLIQVRKMKNIITLAHGSGGKEMGELIKKFSFPTGDWNNTDDDGAILKLGKRKLVYTTDSFVVDPIFFPGGDIGHLAFCGTVNDLCVMGADPLGLSLSFVIEEGFSLDDLDRIVATIRTLSEKHGIPIVTGDTKVMERGKLDKIIINTSGIGELKADLTKSIAPGDKIILSGGLGEHAVALLSKRFDYTTSIVSDSKPLDKEMAAVRDKISIAKDPTRGGLAAVLNEIAERHKVGLTIHEDKVPFKKEVGKVVDMLGIGLYELASEGRVVCVVPEKNAKDVVKALKRFNKDAAIIGEVREGDTVVVQTMLGSHVLPVPTGRIVPRIC
jgi:hydrogenase expression/formation protein HypE